MFRFLFEFIKKKSFLSFEKILFKIALIFVTLFWYSTSGYLYFELPHKPDLSWLDTDGLGLGQKEGALVVDERMQSSVPGIYAVGDVVGGIMLAHVAMAEGECAASNAMGEDTVMRYDAIPLCIYTSPEVASVGLSEEAARERGPIEVGRFSFHGSGKALILDETYGMVKIFIQCS